MKGNSGKSAPIYPEVQATARTTAYHPEPEF